MANFAIANSTAMGAGNVQAAIAATYKSLVVIGNSTTSTANLGSGMLRRGKLYDILIGTNGTPADNFMEFDVTRVTVGTSSVLGGGLSSLSSTMGLDPADSNGFINLATINTSIETAMTATTEVWYVGINQRASYRWVAAPGSEIVWPAVSSVGPSNGIALRARSAAYTGTATATTLWQEQ
jgi:hypothetical protein